MSLVRLGQINHIYIAKKRTSIDLTSASENPTAQLSSILEITSVKNRPLEDSMFGDLAQHAGTPSTINSRLFILWGRPLHLTGPRPAVSPAPGRRKNSASRKADYERHKSANDRVPCLGDTAPNVAIGVSPFRERTAAPVVHVMLDAATLPTSVWPKRATVRTEWPVRNELLAPSPFDASQCRLAMQISGKPRVLEWLYDSRATRKTKNYREDRNSMHVSPNEIVNAT